MLAHWFARSGIGQLVAPDERIAQFPPPDDSDLLQFLAPDPKHAPPKAPPPAAFHNGVTLPQHQQVQCQHCHQWTDVGAGLLPTASNIAPAPASAVSAVSAPTVSTPANNSNNNNNSINGTSGASARGVATPFMTPSPSHHHPGSGMFSPGAALDSNVERLVLSAAQATAQSTFSPPPFQKSRDKVFRLCTTVNLNDNLGARLRKILEKDPSLLRARAVHMGQQAPDGFTPIMAAAYSGSAKSTEILLELAGTTHVDKSVETPILMERDYHGRTALHLAAEYGHLDVVQILLPKYQLGPSMAAPLDLTGKTALGRAITSPQPSARKQRSQLEKALYRPGDLSIMGFSKPEAERTAKDEDLRLAYGVADMPGMRVDMEDAMCTAHFECAGKTYWLFGVCDGHGDQGSVSDFVATRVPQVLQSHMARQTDDLDWNAIWKATCLEVDEELHQAQLIGGSTAVFSLVSQDTIVVANVGDSRAILIRSGTNINGLEEQMDQMAIAESSAYGYPATIDGDESETTTPGKSIDTPTNPSGPFAISLSDDHKPNLAQEEARILNAGMKVVPVTFEDEGQQVTIYKVAKSDTDMLAVSRAFGDFDYKSNPTLPPDEQAVMAVPDIYLHSRDHASDLYMVLACDGIWDVCDNDMVKDFVLEQVEVRREISDTVLPEVGDALLRESLNRGSKDNMTTIIVALSGEADKVRTVIRAKVLDFASL